MHQRRHDETRHNLFALLLFHHDDPVIKLRTEQGQSRATLSPFCEEIKFFVSVKISCYILYCIFRENTVNLSHNYRYLKLHTRPISFQHYNFPLYYKSRYLGLRSRHQIPTSLGVQILVFTIVPLINIITKLLSHRESYYYKIPRREGSASKVHTNMGRCRLVMRVKEFHCISLEMFRQEMSAFVNQKFQNPLNPINLPENIN